MCRRLPVAERIQHGPRVPPHFPPMMSRLPPFVTSCGGRQQRAQFGSSMASHTTGFSTPPRPVYPAEQQRSLHCEETTPYVFVQSNDSESSSRLLSQPPLRFRSTLTKHCSLRGPKEMMDDLLEDIPVVEQLILFSQLSGILAVTSLALSLLCGTDPLGTPLTPRNNAAEGRLVGGFDLLHPSLNHCLCGVTASTPLILIRWATLTDGVPRFVAEYAVKFRENRLFLSKNLPLWEALLATTMLSASTTFLIFPGLVGNMASSLQTYLASSAVLSDDGAFYIWALLAVSTGIGVVEGGSLAPLPEEMETVISAVKNSDRYYRLTTPTESGPRAARIQSDAFRRASLEFMRTSANACMLGGFIACLETFYGGMLWRLTGDVATTICLFLCVELGYRVYSEGESGP